MAKIRSGGWTAVQRKKLTAIRTPHKSDPKDFYYDAQSAWMKLETMLNEGLNESGRDTTSWGSLPEHLNAHDEMEREKALGSWVGIGWRDGGGRNFSEEFWNPLMGLWVDREGFGFVFDLTFPDPSKPTVWPYYANDAGSFWAAARRYLYKLSDEAYGAAQKRIEPIMDEIFGTADWEESKTRDYIALTFTRGTDWAEKLIRGYVDGTAKPGDMGILIAGCTDADLAVAAVKKYGGLSSVDAVYHVFDMVESMGADAARVLEMMTPYGSFDKKRVASALKIAKKLAG